MKGKLIGESGNGFEARELYSITNTVVNVFWEGQEFSMLLALAFGREQGIVVLTAWLLPSCVLFFFPITCLAG